MIEGTEEIHATEHKNNEGNGRKGHIDTEQNACHIPEARQQAVRRRPGRFGIMEIECILPGCRQEGNENDDDAQPSQPVGHAAPEQNTERQAFYIFYDRSPCTGKAGNAFKHTVNQIQVPASHIGNHPQEGG